MGSLKGGGGSIADGSIGTVKLGQDITTAGKALLDDANAAAQRTTLGLAAYANPQVVSASLSADVTISSTSYTDVTGLLLNITTTVGNQVIQLNFSGWAYIPTPSAGVTIEVGYKLDAGSDVPMVNASSAAAVFGMNASWSTTFTIASAGAHTIQIRAKKSGDTYRINGLSANGAVARVNAAVLQGTGD